ncbi:MAG: DUF2130 domain-containing protein [bacterium]
MAEPTIICPKCKTQIKLTESLAAPLLEATRKDFEQLLADKDESIAKKEKSLHRREEALIKERETLETTVEDRLKSEQARIAKEEARKAKLALATDLEEKDKKVSELEQTLKKRDEKLAEAQKAQADLLKMQREFEDAKREIDLTIEKRVQESIGAARDQALKQAEEQLKFKVMEKEQTIAAMQKQIEELKRRGEQGSQQLQGEVQELELENILRSKFPHDIIEPVPKGEYGGDVLQRVVNPLGQRCGTIIWESKRTKAWSDTWLPKLREDQRSAKAETAVIVSQVLPKDIDPFGLVDGVWVTNPKSAIPVAVLLRQAMFEVTAAHVASEGQQTKMEMVYQYLTGPRFRQRVQAIVESFSSMQEDLDKEKKAILKQWAKREEQIDRVMQSTIGMYGDMQGIAGKSLQEIEGLELHALEAPAKSDE